jgi:hypothetical protein
MFQPQDLLTSFTERDQGPAFGSALCVVGVDAGCGSTQYARAAVLLPTTALYCRMRRQRLKSAPT